MICILAYPNNCLLQFKQNRSSPNRLSFLNTNSLDNFTNGIVSRGDPNLNVSGKKLKKKRTTKSYRGLHSFQLDDSLIVVLDLVTFFHVDLPHIGLQWRRDRDTDDSGFI